MNTTLSCRELNKLTRTSLTDTKQLKLFSSKSQWVGVSDGGVRVMDSKEMTKEQSLRSCLLLTAVRVVSFILQRPVLSTY